MAEGLGRIAQLLSRVRELLAKHRVVIREAQHVLEEVHRAHEIPPIIRARTSQCFHEPLCTLD